MTHVSLFSGIGGIDLAAEWAGFRTIAQVESDLWRKQVLAARFTGVKRFTDIRTFPGSTRFGAITLVSGGFPCQPFSCAGKRRGQDDHRNLWPEMARVIRALKPAWVVAENTAGAIQLVLDRALADLEEAGYSWTALVLPALAVAAWHERQRLFIVAHLDGERRPPKGDGRQSRLVHIAGTAQSFRQGTDRKLAQSATDVESGRQQGRRLSAGPWSEGEGATDVVRPAADSDKKYGHTGRHGAGPVLGNRPEEADLPGSEVAIHSLEPGSTQLCGSPAEPESAWRNEPRAREWWETECGLVRVVYGLPRWLDRHCRRRVAALGDSCIPAQVYPILQAIAEIERSNLG